MFAILKARDPAALCMGIVALLMLGYALAHRKATNDGASPGRT